MAFESTAINDLVAGLQRKPLERDEDDWLFGERDSLFRDDATEIDPRRMDPSPIPVASQGSAPLQLRQAQGSPQYGAPLAPRQRPVTQQPVVPLPQPFQRMPAPAIDHVFDRSRTPTTYVRSTDWTGIAKKAALPIGLACIVVVLLGVYFAKSGTKTSETKPVAMNAAPAAAAPAPKSDPVVVTPVVTPIEKEPAKEVEQQPAKEVVAAEAPKVEAAEAAEAAEAPKVEAPKVEAPKVEAPKAAPPEPVNIEPGSPASRFLGAAEPTVPTVPTTTTKPAPAPAPTVVSDMPAPRVEAKAKAPAEELGVTVIAKKKKSRAELRAEKRAAAKRAVKASLAKARAKKRVAADEPAADDEEEAAPKQPEKSAPAAKEGKGTLSIASSPAMEVWVDGRNSKAMTPVRVILLAGKHKVTLFDKENAKARSFDIEIKPGETTKIVKNYE